MSKQLICLNCNLGWRRPEAGHVGAADDSDHGSDLAAGGTGPAHCQLQMHLNW